MAALARIVAWSLHHRAVVLFATLLLVGFGVRAAQRLPIDAVPDSTNVQVQVVTTAPALSPLEIETYVSIPVERALGGLPSVAEVRSLSKYGISVVTVVFTDDTDIWFARQLVDERMPEARAAVGDFGAPEMAPISTGLGEIYQFTVRNDALDAMALNELLVWYIAPKLRTVPGVVELNSMGGYARQYQVIVDVDRLQAMDLSLAEVVTALERANGNAGGGYIEHNREQIVVGTSGLVRDLADLEEVVLGSTPQGAPITVAMIGDVQFGPRMRHGAVTMDGESEVVVGVTMMLMGANARTVIHGIEAELAALAPSLPDGTRIEPFYDRSALVDRTIHTVAVNLAEGAALVMFVLFVLLGDLRAGIVVATTIPLSLVFAVIAMHELGISGNLMSLGAIDFGLIVDGAVIVVENAARRLSEAQRARGRPLSAEERIEVVRDATLEVRRAAVYGEIIVAIVYVPVLMLTGIEGKLFTPMAVTVLLALAGAFVLSMTVVPVLASLLVRPREHHHTRFVQWCVVRYERVLATILHRRRTTVAVAGALLVGVGLVGTRVGAEFVPQLDEGDLLVEAHKLTGVSLTESLAIDRRVEQRLLEIPEILHVVAKTGAPDLAVDAMGIEQTDVYLQLADRDDWRAGWTKDDLAAEVERALADAVPDMAISISQPIQMRTNEMLAGVRADVGILLYGPDLAELERLGERAVRIVAPIAGVVDVKAERPAGLGYLRIAPDRPALARWGLDVADVNLVAQSLAVGREAGVVLEADRRFDVVVKVDTAFVGDLRAIEDIPLRSAAGRYVRLGDVADVTLGRGPALVNRSDQSRRLVVQFNVRGRDLASAAEDAQRAIEAELDAPAGYHVEYGGTFAHWLEARDRLAVLVPIVLVLIVALLWMALESVGAAALIFLAIPFAATGGFAALWLRGIPFSISAGVGFIALAGIAVLNGLVLVTFALRHEDEGLTPIEAIRTASAQRLRPVLMTALVAALGFLPMALSTAPGSEVQRPLATVVIGGLVTATMLTLFVLPAVYPWVRRRRS